ncbi:MAG TPA: hypothetical protein DCM05_09725 [Elusimicrobia bacterium]|nr:hypothetical protein [Elusimicrobiota bacterium]
MTAAKTRVYNLIPLLAGKAESVTRLEGSPRDALAAVRESCEFKGSSPSAWAASIEKHCPLPLEHPFRKTVDGLPPGDPLRTLACWAYGAGNSWITLEEVVWENGTKSRPQEEHRDWMRQQSARLSKD